MEWMEPRCALLKDHSFLQWYGFRLSPMWALFVYNMDPYICAISSGWVCIWAHDYVLLDTHAQHTLQMSGLNRGDRRPAETLSHKKKSIYWKTIQWRTYLHCSLHIYYTSSITLSGNCWPVCFQFGISLGTIKKKYFLCTPTLLVLLCLPWMAAENSVE